MSNKGGTVTDQSFPRLGAACGILFSVGLFSASSIGGYVGIVVGSAALVLFLPFLGYLWRLLQVAEGESGWLSATAFAAGLVGITIKLLSIVPEAARRHVSEGTPLYKVLDDMLDAATVMSLLPLALFLGVVVVLTARTRVLPRWLRIGGAATAVVLAINGGFLYTDSAPGLLLFVLWTLVASVVLLRRAWGERAQVTQAPLAAS
jgi:hypothetical protein